MNPSVDFGPVRLAHANIFVENVGRSAAFYRDICGLCQVAAEPDIKAAFLSNGASHHDVGLMQVSDKPLVGRDGKVQNTMERGRVPGLNHVAFEVNTEAGLVDAYRRAVNVGVAIEKTLDHGMSRSVYLFDPDRNAVEFFADVVPSWRDFYQAHKDQLISAQWDPLAGTPLSTGLSQNPPTRDRHLGARYHASEIAGMTLIVEDLSASLAFYTHVGGLACRAVGEEVALLGTPVSQSSCLALVEKREGEKVGLHALWFALQESSASPGKAGTLERDDQDRPWRWVELDPDGTAIALYLGADRVPQAPRRQQVMITPS